LPDGALCAQAGVGTSIGGMSASMASCVACQACSCVSSMACSYLCGWVRLLLCTAALMMAQALRVRSALARARTGGSCRPQLTQSPASQENVRRR